LPPAGDKLAMLSGAISALLGEGYTYIGMDHFALPEDPLAVAKRQGLLHRGFQGYSTQPDCDLIGLGVSSISRVGATYAQNAKTMEEYEDALRQRQLPVQRGLSLSRDDLVRRAVIMALMCQGRLEFESIASSYLIDVPTYFAAEFDRLKQLAEQGLIVLEPGAIQVTPLGWYFVRAVALVFDRYLQADASRERFSKII
jgi:oxygen-independent coproporphyrinogen-3 oxidase